MNMNLAKTRRRGALLALLSMISALLALTVANNPASAADPVATGQATWGIKSSYRHYINGPGAQGSTTVSDGAVWLDGPGNGKGPFTFPVRSAAFDPATKTGEINFAGTVYTGGHDAGQGPLLETQWSNLRLVINNTTGTLYSDLDFRPFVAADPSLPLPPGQSADDVGFATLDLSGVDWSVDGTGSRTINAAPATGITAAMDLIGWDQFYSAEMPNPPLDPFSVTFSVGEDPSSTTTTSPATTSSTTTTTVAPTIPAGEAEVTGGELSWQVNSSFVNYINGPVGEGSIDTTAGASGAPKGPFLFPATVGQKLTVSAPNLSVGFQGRIHIAAHQYGTHPPALEMAFSNLRVVKSGNTGRLLADVESRPFLTVDDVGPLNTYRDATLANLDFSQAHLGLIGSGVGWLEVPATIPADGAALWGNFYEGGQALAPLNIKLNLSEIPGGLKPATPPPAKPGPVVTLSATSVVAGGTLNVKSSGFTPSEQIEVWIHSTPSFVQTVRADANGAVDASVTIPRSTANGAHRLELRGISSGISAFSPEFQVTGSQGATGSKSQLPRTGTNTAPALYGLLLLMAGTALVSGATRIRRRQA